MNAGLGPFPVLNLAAARKNALENARQALRGEDPQGGGIPTFRQAAERVVELRARSCRPGSRLSSHWRQSFESYAFPVLGRKSVAEVTSADVLACLTPIWSSKPAMARKLRQRLSVVFRWTVAAGFCDGDPARDIGEALPKNGRHIRHHRALPHSRVGAAIRRVRASSATAGVKGAVTDPAGNSKLAKGAEGGRRMRAKDDALAAAILGVAAGSRQGGRPKRPSWRYAGVA